MLDTKSEEYHREVEKNLKRSDMIDTNVDQPNNVIETGIRTAAKKVRAEEKPSN